MPCPPAPPREPPAAQRDRQFGGVRGAAGPAWGGLRARPDAQTRPGAPTLGPGPIGAIHRHPGSCGKPLKASPGAQGAHLGEEAPQHTAQLLHSASGCCCRHPVDPSSAVRLGFAACRPFGSTPSWRKCDRAGAALQARRSASDRVGPQGTDRRSQTEHRGGVPAVWRSRVSGRAPRAPWPPGERSGAGVAPA